MSCQTLYAVGINKQTNKAEVISWDRDTEYWYPTAVCSRILSHHLSSQAAHAWLQGEETYNEFIANIELKYIVQQMHDVCPEADPKKLYKAAKRCYKFHARDLETWDVRDFSMGCRL